MLVTLADYHCLIMCIRIQLGTQGAETPPISLGAISNQVCPIIIISLILIRPRIQFVYYRSNNYNKSVRKPMRWLERMDVLMIKILLHM